MFLNMLPHLIMLPPILHFSLYQIDNLSSLFQLLRLQLLSIITVISSSLIKAYHVWLAKVRLLVLFRPNHDLVGMSRYISLAFTSYVDWVNFMLVSTNVYDIDNSILCKARVDSLLSSSRYTLKIEVPIGSRCAHLGHTDLLGAGVVISCLSASFSRHLALNLTKVAMSTSVWSFYPISVVGSIPLVIKIYLWLGLSYVLALGVVTLGCDWLDLVSLLSLDNVERRTSVAVSEPSTDIFSSDRSRWQWILLYLALSQNISFVETLLSYILVRSYLLEGVGSSWKKPSIVDN